MSERTASAQSDFDFWLGHWTVTLTDTGEVIGHNDIELRHDGRVLAEHYTTLNGRFSGSSLNGFDATTGRWHQCWMDNGGLVLDLYGGRVGESMVMTRGVDAGHDAANHLEPSRRWIRAPTLGAIGG